MLTKPKLRPPQVLFILIGLAAAIQFIFHLEGHVSMPFRFLGGIIFLGGLSFVLWVVSIFAKRNTSIPYKVRPTAFVTEGPFQRTRNPMYLGGLVMLFGLALMVGTWPFFVVPFLMYLILNAYHVPWEEQVMLETFRDDFIEYARRVPRWL